MLLHYWPVLEENSVKMRKILEILVNLPNIAPSLISSLKNIICFYMIMDENNFSVFENSSSCKRENKILFVNRLNAQNFLEF